MPYFYKITDIQYTPSSENITFIDKNRPIWPTLDTSEYILLEDQKMLSNDQNC